MSSGYGVIKALGKGNGFKALARGECSITDCDQFLRDFEVLEEGAIGKGMFSDSSHVCAKLDSC